MAGTSGTNRNGRSGGINSEKGKGGCFGSASEVIRAALRAFVKRKSTPSAWRGSGRVKTSIEEHEGEPFGEEVRAHFRGRG
ncbi:type II toxin-antitoxin system ParD family antitoxin [Mesorhizobium sp. CO1-1-8]|uniref:ribbon-helix-helix domain-containing protein n=1 Tax=Mesorhizobium sp. CO1-1-8 TaxID=2876631 RepID=UPI00398F77E9